MSDLDHIESLVGSLEKGREYHDASMLHWGESVFLTTEAALHRADAALTEAWGLLEEMSSELFALRCVYRELTGKNWNWERRASDE